MARRPGSAATLVSCSVWLASCAAPPDVALPTRVAHSDVGPRDAEVKTRADGCRTLIALINDPIAALEARSTDPDDPVAELEAMAAIMDRVATERAKLTLTTPDLATLADEYSAMTASVARASREMASSVRATDPQRMAEAEADLRAASVKESSIVDAVNAACR